MTKLESGIASAVSIDLDAVVSALTPDEQSKLSEVPQAKECYKKLAGQLNNIATLGRLRYDSGDYAAAAKYMKLAIKILFDGSEAAASSAVSHESLLWGSVAAFVLAKLRSWAVFAVSKLSERVEAQSRSAAAAADPKTALKSRVWLLHWAVFAFFMDETVAVPAAVPVAPAVVPADVDAAAEPATATADGEAPVAAAEPVVAPAAAPATQPRYQLSYFEFVTGSERLFNAVKLSAPYLLRYVACAMILIKKKRSGHFEAALRQEAYRYKDAITELCLDIISGADASPCRKQVFADCAALMEGDYFLAQHFAAFRENAREILLDLFIRTSQSFNTEFVAEKLGFETKEEAAEWVDKRNSPLLVKAEGREGVYLVQTSGSSAYLQVIAKYRNLFYKTKTLKLSIAEIGGEGNTNTNSNNNSKKQPRK